MLVVVGMTSLVVLWLLLLVCRCWRRRSVEREGDQMVVVVVRGKILCVMVRKI